MLREPTQRSKILRYKREKINLNKICSKTRFEHALNSIID